MIMSVEFLCGLGEYECECECECECCFGFGFFVIVWFVFDSALMAFFIDNVFCVFFECLFVE